MDKELAITLITAAAPMMLAGIGFFTRAYFKSLEKAITDHAVESARATGELKGQLSGMQIDLRANTIEITKASTQLIAVWRFIDRAHERASDPNGVG